jgi:hypothetical protein
MSPLRFTKIYNVNWNEKKLVSFIGSVVFGSLDLAVVRKDAAGPATLVVLLPYLGKMCVAPRT